MSVNSPKTKAAPKAPPSPGSATMTAEQIKYEAARRAMAEPGLTAVERKAHAARVEADLLAEASAAEQAKAAAAVEAEAQAERARIAGVIRTGADLGRARQAARLALSTPISAEGARSVLATLPADASATPEALAISPSLGTFGTPAAQAERRRVASILSHPEAADRFATASAIALETTLDLSAAVSALMAAPKTEARRYPSLAERSAAAGSFGPDLSGGAGRSPGERTTAMWSKAVAEANASIGATPAPTEATTPPNPSVNDAERTILRGAGAALAEHLKG